MYEVTFSLPVFPHWDAL